MRMFFIFILFLLPVRLYAASCEGLNESECKTTSGCHWETVCRPCLINHYCENSQTLQNQEKSCADNAKLQGFDYPASIDNSGEYPNHPISELVFDKSFAGASSIDECYVQLTCTDYSDETVTSHEDCRLTYGNARIHEIYGPVCGSNQTADTNYFIKTAFNGTNNTLICESNFSLCSNFTSLDCDGGTVTGTAATNQSSQSAPWRWDISQCKCEKLNILIETQWPNNSSGITYKCIGTETFTNSTSVLESHYDEISWDPSNSTYHYYCTGCPTGYYLETSTNYNWVQSNQSSLGQCINPNNTLNNFVCGCTQVQKGYYKENDCSWNYSLDVAPDCDQNPCATGQTTNQAGSTAANACHYDATTQFCDGPNGDNCFNLGDLGTGLTASDWQQLP